MSKKRSASNDSQNTDIQVLVPNVRQLQVLYCSCKFYARVPKVGYFILRLPIDGVANHPLFSINVAPSGVRDQYESLPA